MLAKVSDTYCGSFGLFDPETKSNKVKTKESAPFEVDDALFKRLSENGVLVKADGKVDKPEKKPSTPPAPADLEDDIPDNIEEDPEEEALDLENLNYNELKEVAKSYGITCKVGMSKDDLKDAIREAADEEPPALTAEEPE